MKPDADYVPPEPCKVVERTGDDSIYLHFGDGHKEMHESGDVCLSMPLCLTIASRYNACVGMADPAAEIAKLRAIKDGCEVALRVAERFEREKKSGSAIMASIRQLLRDVLSGGAK